MRMWVSEHLMYRIRIFLKWHPKQSFEWHSASSHDPQQSFDHCLQVCWRLCHRPCASWLRRRLCEIDKCYDLTHFVRRTKKCRHFHSIVSLCGAILKYKTITYFFLRCHSHRASGELNKCHIITAKQPKLKLRFCSIFFDPPTIYFLRENCWNMLLFVLYILQYTKTIYLHLLRKFASCIEHCKIKEIYWAKRCKTE